MNKFTILNGAFNEPGHYLILERYSLLMRKLAEAQPAEADHTLRFIDTFIIDVVANKHVHRTCDYLFL